MVVTMCFSTAKPWYKTHFCLQVFLNSKCPVSIPPDFNHDIATEALSGDELLLYHYNRLKKKSVCVCVREGMTGEGGTGLLYLGILFSQDFRENEKKRRKSLPRLLVKSKTTATKRTSYKLPTQKFLRDTLVVSVN